MGRFLHWAALCVDGLVVFLGLQLVGMPAAFAPVALLVIAVGIAAATPRWMKSYRPEGRGAPSEAEAP